jgi:UDP-N-acetylmuramate-alanine ligase
MNLNQIHNVYFIGIGGIGMSALSAILKYREQVSGYDKTPTATKELIEWFGHLKIVGFEIITHQFKAFLNGTIL